ncbi:MAG TPA: hypothetical protein VEK79_23750 [Thermoanaerobaculia bacterium]|nr:hypothetical protein [Thermoanaerobaculia bacterium]
MLVDGVRNFSQRRPELDFLLAPNSDSRHGQSERRKDADDGHHGDQLGDGEARGCFLAGHGDPGTNGSLFQSSKRVAF